MSHWLCSCGFRFSDVIFPNSLNWHVVRDDNYSKLLGDIDSYAPPEGQTAIEARDAISERFNGAYWDQKEDIWACPACHRLHWYTGRSRFTIVWRLESPLPSGLLPFGKFHSEPPMHSCGFYAGEPGADDRPLVMTVCEMKKKFRVGKESVTQWVFALPKWFTMKQRPTIRCRFCHGKVRLGQDRRPSLHADFVAHVNDEDDRRCEMGRLWDGSSPHRMSTMPLE